METRFWIRTACSLIVASLPSAATLAGEVRPAPPATTAAPAAVVARASTAPRPAIDCAVASAPAAAPAAIALVAPVSRSGRYDVKAEKTPAYAYALAYASPDSDEDDEDQGVPHKKNKVRVYRHVVPGGKYGFLGVGVADIDEDRAQELDVKGDHGVEIKMVNPGSAADKAGVKVEDVVLEFDGNRIDGTGEFVRMVRETEPGQKVKLLVLRDGRTMTLTATMGKKAQRVVRLKRKGHDGDDEDVTIEVPGDDSEPGEAPTPSGDPQVFEFEMPDIPEINMPDVPTPLLSWQAPRLGVETESVGSQLAEYFGVREGVLVRSVLKGSVAEKAGLKAGDVITKIADQNVAKAGDIARALRSQEAGEPFSIELVRNRRELNLTAKLEDRSAGRKERRRSHSSGSGKSWSSSESEGDSDSEDH